jgi:neutral ceramidase
MKFRGGLRWTGFLVLGAVAVANPAGAETKWRAGAAAVAITPREPMWMAGYGARNRPSEGVLHELHAKALALQDERGTTVVIVTADILGFSREMADSIASRAKERFGLSRRQLLLSASHTHSGPVTGEVLRPAYPLDQAQIAMVNRYTAGFLDQIVDLIGASMANLEPAELWFEQGLAGFAVNRRRVGNRSRPGPVDQDVPVLSVRTADGRLKAIVFGYACHNTNLSGYKYSGDYAGIAQAEIERTHPGATALFIAGCGADANPLPRGTVDIATMYGKILAEAVEQVLKAKMRNLSGPLKTAFEYADLPFQTAPTPDALQADLSGPDPARQRYARYLLDELKRKGSLRQSYPCPLEIWQVGGLTLIAMGGEVVADYALRFKAQYGWDTSWVAAYTNDVFAYVPSLRVLREGGYEGGGAMVPYGQPAPFKEEVEEIITKKVDEMVKQVRTAR